MDDVDDRPWERPGEVLRDAEPHRGQLLVLLGTISLWCGLLSFALVIPSVLGLPLSVVAFVVARRDLGKLRVGRMDCRGIDKTAHGRNLAFVGLITNLVGLLVLPGVWLAASLILP